jgi:hypothetical protein
MVAGAYARATDGIVFNPELSELRTADEAADVVRELEASPLTEATLLEHAVIDRNRDSHWG